MEMNDQDRDMALEDEDQDQHISRKWTAYLGWFWRLGKPVMPKVLALTLVQTIAGLTGVAMALASKYMIDAAVAKSMASLFLWGGIFGGLIIFSMAMDAVLTLMSTRLGEGFENTVRERIFGSITGTQWYGISQYHSGDLMTRLTDDVETVSESITGLIPQIISLGFKLCAAFTVLYIFDPILAVLAFFLVPVTLLLSRFFGRRMKRLYHHMQESESAFRAYIQESMQQVLIVKTFQLESHSIQHLEKLHGDKLNWAMKKTRYSVVAEAMMGLGYWLGYFLAFAWGAFRLSMGVISFGTMAAFLQLVEQVQAPLTGLAYSFPQIIAAIGSAERIMELEDLDQETDTIANHSLNAVGFRFNQVDFAYEAEDQVLNDVSMCVAPHEIVALMGPSGEGKTTMVRLLLALIKPNQGEILITDDTGKDIPINASTRQFMTYVPQGNTLFSGTIEDNLKVADQAASREDLMEALVKADAWSFVQELPEGLNTFLGEDGLGISEGQAQRIAIARALLRKAPILILDEATSALDLDAEERILKAIHEDPIKRTCLIITHRPSALRICSSVYRLADGILELV